MGLFLLIHLMLIYHWFWIGLDWIVSQQQEQEQDIHIYLSLLVYKFHFFFFCHFVLVGYCFLISLGSGSFSILGFFLANWGLCLSFCLFGANCSRVWRRHRERERERERESNWGNFLVFSFVMNPFGVGLMELEFWGKFFFSLAV